MRVGHFIETEMPGGAESVMIDLVLYAREQGFEPVLLHFGSEWVEAQAEQLGIEQAIIPEYALFKSTKTLPLFAYKFSRFLKAQRIDILHSHLFGPITAAAPAAFLAGIAHVGTVHDVYMIEEKPARIRLMQLAAMLGTRLVAVSKHMEAFYRGAAYFSPQGFSTIYNGINPANYQPRSNKPAPKPDDKVRIICVGRLVALKQVAVIVEQVLQLCESGMAVELTVVGDGPEKEHITTLLAGHPQAQAIHMLGARTDVAELLNSSDIFVQYSTTEGLSRSILEAVAVGLPAIVSDVGGNAEIVDNHCGRLVSASAPDQLKNALAELIADAPLRASMGANGALRIPAVFGRALCNGQYKTLYQQLYRA